MALGGVIGAIVGNDSVRAEKLFEQVKKSPVEQDKGTVADVLGTLVKKKADKSDELARRMGGLL